MAQQTAVEWLEIQIRNFNDRKQTHYEYDQMFIQAKQIKKEQTKNAFQESRLVHPIIGFKHQTFEQYYNETHNK